MISAAHPAASWFLYGLCLVVGIAFAAPLLFAPVRWARAFGWKVPEDTDLVVYLGRCVGGLVAALIVVAVRVAPRPEAHLVVFQLIGFVAAIIAVVHVLGALEGRQPRIETVETVLFAAVAAAAWWFARALSP